MDETPVEVRRVEGRAIHVRWADGHESVFPNAALRRGCPCAQCVHELTGARLLDPASVAEDIRADEIALVGRYAMRIRWSDGHGTGIFTWRALREACPCERCRGRDAGPSPPALEDAGDGGARR